MLNLDVSFTNRYRTIRGAMAPVAPWTRCACTWCRPFQDLQQLQLLLPPSYFNRLPSGYKSFTTISTIYNFTSYSDYLLNNRLYLSTDWSTPPFCYLQIIQALQTPALKLGPMCGQHLAEPSDFGRPLWLYLGFIPEAYVILPKMLNDQVSVG